MPRDKTGHFYYPRYPTIWRSDTSHLSLADDGAYGRLVEQYMIDRFPLPNNDKALSVIIGVTVEEWQAIRPRLIDPVGKPYFQLGGDGRLHHAFCDSVLAEDNARIDRSRVNGSKGGRPSHSNNSEKNQQVSGVKPAGSSNPSQPERTEPNNPNPAGGVGHGDNLKNGHGTASGLLMNGSGSGRAGIVLKPDTLISAKKILPRADIYAIEAEFKKSGKDIPNNPDGAFIGYCKKLAEKNPNMKD